MVPKLNPLSQVLAVFIAKPLKCRRRVIFRPVAMAEREADGLLPLVSGKRFTCTECGMCCQGEGEVWSNDAEIAGMAKLLGISLSDFISKYCKGYSRRQGWHLLKHDPGTRDCIFLQGNKCTVYGARPLQCSTYPWWPELMPDIAWESEGRLACEGINQAEALEVDGPEAASKLLAASVYFAEFEAALTPRSANHRK